MRVRLGGFIYCGSCFVFFQSRSSRFPCSFLLLFLKSFVSSGSIYFYSRSKGKEKLKEVLYFGISLKRKILPYLSIRIRKEKDILYRQKLILCYKCSTWCLFSIGFDRSSSFSSVMKNLVKKNFRTRDNFDVRLLLFYYSPYFDTSMPLRKVSTGSRNKETAASCRERRARTVR